MTLPDPPPEMLAAMRRLYEGARILPDASPEALSALLRELRARGLYDTPTWHGLSSSVRQYALSVLGHQLDYANRLDRPLMIFGTMHPGLLAQARDLADSYGVRPMTPPDMLAYARKEGPP